MRAEWALVIACGMVSTPTLAAPNPRPKQHAIRFCSAASTSHVPPAACPVTPSRAERHSRVARPSRHRSAICTRPISPATRAASRAGKSRISSARYGWACARTAQLLYPGMPYTSYAHMSRDDMAALWNYLRLMPAVSHATPQAALIFPFNLRPGLAIWQSLYYKPTPFTPLSAKSEAWNRGHYLVEALGHCNTCHSSLNSAAGAEGTRQLTPGAAHGVVHPRAAERPCAGKRGSLPAGPRQPDSPHRRRSDGDGHVPEGSDRSGTGSMARKSPPRRMRICAKAS